MDGLVVDIMCPVAGKSKVIVTIIYCYPFQYTRGYGVRGHSAKLALHFARNLLGCNAL